MTTITQTKATRPAALGTTGFKTLMVHVEPGLRSSRRVEIAAQLAVDFGARLIGVGAEAFQPPPEATAEAAYAVGEYTVLVRERIDEDLENAEVAFRRDAAMAGQLEWRQARDYPARVLAHEARAADLIVASPRREARADHAADPSDLVMQCGRPVLLVPRDAPHFSGAVAVVAWKETRETRRAVVDALPLLRRAGDVIVLAVCEDGDFDGVAAQVEDVVDHLRRHDVVARAKVVEKSDRGPVAEIESLISQTGADLLVAGAYGHSRFQEWVFGGVTSALLHDAPTYTFVSH